MPKGYVIFDEVINDQDGYNGYIGKAGPTLAQYGGRLAVLQDNPELLEGKWFGSRVVVLEFDSVDAARTWYNSPEYQAVVGERHASCDANVVIVTGFDMPGS